MFFTVAFSFPFPLPGLGLNCFALASFLLGRLPLCPARRYPRVETRHEGCVAALRWSYFSQSEMISGILKQFKLTTDFHLPGTL